jgi:hypothetical protein
VARSAPPRRRVADFADDGVERFIGSVAELLADVIHELAQLARRRRLIVPRR